jgi:hypothetical protein
MALFIVQPHLLDKIVKVPFIDPPFENRSQPHLPFTFLGLVSPPTVKKKKKKK